ncbi:MAG: hypothetical protein ACFN06_00480 [Limosilactobacillus oris]
MLGLGNELGILILPSRLTTAAPGSSPLGTLYQELPAANEARIIVPQPSLEACSAGTEGGYRNWGGEIVPVHFCCQ